MSRYITKCTTVVYPDSQLNCDSHYFCYIRMCLYVSQLVLVDRKNEKYKTFPKALGFGFTSSGDGPVQPQSSSTYLSVHVSRFSVSSVFPPRILSCTLSPLCNCGSSFLLCCTNIAIFICLLLYFPSVWRGQLVHCNLFQYTGLWSIVSKAIALRRWIRQAMSLYDFNMDDVMMGSARVKKNIRNTFDLL